MARAVRIGKVPDRLHRRLRARAKSAGMSLSAYLLRELKRVAERPTMEELERRLRTREAVELPISAARLIRQQRGR